MHHLITTKPEETF